MNNKLYLNNSAKFKSLKKVYTKETRKKLDNIFLEIKNDILKKNKTLNVLDKNFKFNFKLKDLIKFKKYKKLAIIGMGGSILGAEAIYNFFEARIKKKVYFFNDLNEKKLQDFKRKENFKSVLFIIISKSGNTIETLSNSFSLNIIKKNSKNIIIITEKKDNSLYNLAKKFNLYFIEHKKNIGGRFSVLSEVGVVPAYLMGINILNLRLKILDFLKGFEKNYLKESAYTLSEFLLANNFNNIVFLNYSPNLEKFLFWCQQLIAESLGKNHKGFFPVVSSMPKDHHSLLQLYLDGPEDKIFYIFSDENKSKIRINVKNKLKKNLLHQKLIGSIKKAQKDSLIRAMKKNKTIFREFRIKKINEEVLGKLFSYFILETIVIGKLVKINPFNQPAVEQVKIFTNQFLR